MSITGRCNCSSINVTIPTPEGSVVCYCTNCQRTSAGLCSINYILDTSSAKFDDPKDLLKSYKDSDTKSGNVITRKFCSNCGWYVDSFFP
ncbi:hypothetical protein M011DRAFT_413361 [Sporormia fimetaria CBS 119925]|uniref:CENP-V/GFA domain-containing protein n=1 Tax=Sporormia fimetaria CBS 119925 TaxID=1340428 RepID=A0A6A6UW20_9PLEO|nr:hypothetical protein M011DRAFT_413361 [Sporormia fimetaria CBS 119925]